MTAVAEELSPWRSMPGWSIKAELMPPEVLTARRGRVIRKLMFLALAGLLIICIASYVLVWMQGRSANTALAAENARTAQLQAKARSYNNVVQVKAAISAVEGQIAGLMASDTKIEQVLNDVAGVAPAGMVFSQITVNVAANSQAVGGSALDTGSTVQIGTVSITAVTPRLTDVATYLDALASVPGVIQAYPGPATVGTTGTQFSLQFALSNSLLTHKYDISTGKK